MLLSSSSPSASDHKSHFNSEKKLNQGTSLCRKLLDNLYVDFGPYWTTLDQFGPIWTILSFRHVYFYSSIWNSLICSLYFDLYIWSRLFGPVSLDVSVWPNLVEPVYWNPSICISLLGPVCLDPYIWPQPFMPVYLDLSA